MEETENAKQYVMRYGVTPRCPGCLSAARGGPAAGHMEKCKGRMEGATTRDQDKRNDTYNQRIVEASERLRQETKGNERGMHNEEEAMRVGKGRASTGAC